MKRLFNRLPKVFVSGLMALVIIAGLVPNAYAAFGPNRPTKAWSPSVEGFDHVTFDSFTGVGNGIGDERDFLRGGIVGNPGGWIDPVTNVKQDDTVEAKIYIHNNADSRLNTVSDGHGGYKGIAQNVTVRASIPTTTAQRQDVTGYISASNAVPATIYDTLTVTGNNNSFFSLKYVPGSAQLHKGSQTSVLSDNLVTTGVNLGDQRGCFAYVQEVTFRMKVQKPAYNLNKQVRFEGQTKNDWKENLNVKRGDVVEWKLEFTNTGRTLLKNVIVLDNLPAGVTVVPGSVKLIDGNFPTGTPFGPDAIQDGGKQIHVNIGNVNPGINSIVAFKTKINDVQANKCDVNHLDNAGYVTPEGLTTIRDDASVDVAAKKCVNTPPTTHPHVLPNTGAGDVVGIFAAVTVAGAIAHRYWTSKVTR